jgi:hypothetical protein
MAGIRSRYLSTLTSFQNRRRAFVLTIHSLNFSANDRAALGSAISKEAHELV